MFKSLECLHPIKEHYKPKQMHKAGKPQRKVTRAVDISEMEQIHSNF